MNLTGGVELALGSHKLFIQFCLYSLRMLHLLTSAKYKNANT